MDTGRLGWAKAARSQVVLVKNADSQACPRPILSLDVGPRKWGGPVSRPNQTALTHRFLTRANSLRYTCMQTTDMFCSLSANFKHKDASLLASVGQSTPHQLSRCEKNSYNDDRVLHVCPCPVEVSFRFYYTLPQGEQIYQTNTQKGQSFRPF